MREVIKGFIYEAYNVFLYIAGAAITEEDLGEIRAAGGDKITFWFRRSKRRLGKWFWIAIAAAGILHTVVLWDNIKHKRWGKVTIGIAGYLFLIWFIPHINGAW